MQCRVVVGSITQQDDIKLELTRKKFKNLLKINFLILHQNALLES